VKKPADRKSSAEMLLRGAFLEGDQALEAWDSWYERTGLDTVDPECFALLPLLHRKLEALGTDHAELGRLSEVRQRTWAQNQVVLREACEALRSLAEAGIDTLLLGALALVAGYYRDPGLCPIRQIEILVPRRDTQRASGVLALGAFRVALRQRALPLGCPRQIEQAWWEAATPVGIHEAETRVLAPGDQLLHTLVSAMLRSQTPPAWWMADALTILSDSPVDAGQVAGLATQLRVTLFALRALEQLDAALGQPVAPELLDQLRSAPVSRADRLEYEYVSRARGRRPLLSWLIAPPRRFLRSHS
jgi:hypothetical protein